MKPLKRTIINSIIFFAAYAGVTFALEHTLGVKSLVILFGVYFVLNLVIYTVLDKVSKDN